MARKKTRHVGVYWRHGVDRYMSNGKPDICYDIHYKSGTKYIWEKIGWKSEGYSVEDAIEIRGNRVKALRHPELCSEVADDITVSQAWEIYEKTWLPNLKCGRNVKNIYKAYIEPHFKDTKIGKITAISIETYKQNFLTYLQPITVKAILSNFRMIINKAYQLSNIERKNPISKIGVKNADSRRERYLSHREAALLLDCLEFVSCTVCKVALLSLTTGMRISEITNLKSQDVDIDAGIVYLNGKTGRRCAYLSEKMRHKIAPLVPSNPAHFLFANKKGQAVNAHKVSSTFSEVVNELGFNDGVTDNSQRVVFHTLRHTFCSWLAMEGVPLYTIGELAGHSTVEMTKRYAKLSPDTKREALKYIDTIMSQS